APSETWLTEKQFVKAAVFNRYTQPALNALSQCFITGIDEKINRRGIVKHKIFFHHQILAGMNLLLIPDFIKTTREIIKSFSGEHGEQQFIVRGRYHGKITVQHDLRIRPARHGTSPQLAQIIEGFNLAEQTPVTLPNQKNS